MTTRRTPRWKPATSPASDVPAAPAVVGDVPPISGTIIIGERAPLNAMPAPIVDEADLRGTAAGFAFPHPDPMQAPVTRGDLFNLFDRFGAELASDADRYATQGHDVTAVASIVLRSLANACRVVGDLRAGWDPERHG